MLGVLSIFISSLVGYTVKHCNFAVLTFRKFAAF